MTRGKKLSHRTSCLSAVKRAALERTRRRSSQLDESAAPDLPSSLKLATEVFGDGGGGEMFVGPLQLAAVAFGGGSGGDGELSLTLATEAFGDGGGGELTAVALMLATGAFGGVLDVVHGGFGWWRRDGFLWPGGGTSGAFVYSQEVAGWFGLLGCSGHFTTWLLFVMLAFLGKLGVTEEFEEHCDTEMVSMAAIVKVSM